MPDDLTSIPVRVLKATIKYHETKAASTCVLCRWWSGRADGDDVCDTCPAGLLCDVYNDVRVNDPATAHEFVVMKLKEALSQKQKNKKRTVKK